ncbi:Uncharacterised protein [Weissella viridescens]|uniref:Uncharacterized protein n=1 Tax=Weissella viridescens TaxID=1629 RepID=A0A380P2X2_WEIVI|nr:Uncharacterised protein [Weissella viridescens]
MSEFMIGSSVQVQEPTKLQTPALVMGYDPTSEQYLVRFEGANKPTIQPTN